MKLDFEHLLIKLVSVGLLIKSDKMGQNLKINEQLHSCIKYPRVQFLIIPSGK